MGCRKLDEEPFHELVSGLRVAVEGDRTEVFEIHVDGASGFVADVDKGWGGIGRFACSVRGCKVLAGKQVTTVGDEERLRQEHLPPELQFDASAGRGTSPNGLCVR